MALWRSKKFLAAAFVPIVGIWLYALAQSAGEVSSLMQLVPDRASTAQDQTTAFVTEPPRAQDVAARSGSPVLQAEPEAVPAGPAPAPVLSEAPPDRPSPPAVRPVDSAPAGDYLAEEYPYQRSFDPYLYERVRQEHFDQLPELRIPPGGRDEDRAEDNERGRPFANPELEAAEAD
jgi:hypothetical protein